MPSIKVLEHITREKKVLDIVSRERLTEFVVHIHWGFDPPGIPADPESAYVNEVTLYLYWHDGNQISSYGRNWIYKNDVNENRMVMHQGLREREYLNVIMSSFPTGISNWGYAREFIYTDPALPLYQKSYHITELRTQDVGIASTSTIKEGSRPILTNIFHFEARIYSNSYNLERNSIMNIST